MTRAIAALEEQLRTRLLNRTTRSVSLTDEGVRYLEVSRRLLAVCEEMQDLEIVSEAPPHGLLHVTAPAMFGLLHIMPAIASFLARYPLVDVRAMLLDRVVSLVDAGLDVGVGMGELPDSSLRAVRVGHVHMAVYGSPDYIARRGAPTTPHDLSQHDIISCMAITPVSDTWSFERTKGVDGVRIKPRLVVNTADAAVTLPPIGTRS